jgi:uncharacterized Zn-finger protein
MDTLSLSQAIRLGSMLKPQCFGADRKDGGTCVRAAACDAVGIDSWFDAPREWLNFSHDTEAVCPECGRQSYLSSIAAYCLNDAHRWSRERIADFIEQVEVSQQKVVEAETVSA